MKANIRLMLVDDQQLMRDGLRTLLELEEDLTVVAEAENGAEAIDRYARFRPDVVLMDVRMPVVDGVEATKQLLSQWPESRIIILTTFDDDEYVFEGLRAGARGYLLKAVSGGELAAAIRTVAAGGALIDPSITRKVVAEFTRLSQTSSSPSTAQLDALSEREIEVIRLLAEGYTNREIARKLYLAEGTVKNYVSSILGKLGARDRTHAAILAREKGLM